MSEFVLGQLVDQPTAKRVESPEKESEDGQRRNEGGYTSLSDVSSRVRRGRFLHDGGLGGLGGWGVGWGGEKRRRGTKDLSMNEQLRLW